MKSKEPSEIKVASQLKLNLPPSLHRELKIRAAKNVRSLSGEIVYLTQQGIAAEASRTDGTA